MAQAMRAEIRTAIANGVWPAQYKRSTAQYLQAGNQKVRLIGADSVVTAAGKYFYEQVGAPPPRRYAYEQPLITECRRVHTFSQSTATSAHTTIHGSRCDSDRRAAALHSGAGRNNLNARFNLGRQHASPGSEPEESRLATLPRGPLTCSVSLLVFNQ